MSTGDRHPSWCSARHCTVNGHSGPEALHVSAPLYVRRGARGRPRMLVRLWRRAGTEPVWLEIMLMDAVLVGDASSATSISVDAARALHAGLTHLLAAVDHPPKRH